MKREQTLLLERPSNLSQHLLMGNDYLKADRGQKIGQRELARRVGVHYSTINHLTSGRNTRCSFDLAAKIAHVLDVPVSQIFVERSGTQGNPVERSSAVAPVASEKNKKPKDWPWNEAMSEDFDIRYADGPEFHTADGALNAWSAWDDKKGITVVIDNADRDFTLAEAIEFRDQFNALLNKITGEGK